MPDNKNNGQKVKSRLIYIEPNEFASTYHKSANTTELCWNYEDLTMAVDLQVIIPRREDCGQRSYIVESEAVVKNIQHNPLGRYVSFLGGTKLEGNDANHSFLTDNYTDISYQEISQNHTISKEALGINSIDINFDANFFPIITMKFTDTRGYSLFMPSEYEFDESVKNKDKQEKKDEAVGSFFKALFHFPYPMFLLSVKGFYGNRITFRLAVSDFRSSFNADNGNFDVTVQFIGYVYGLYTDLPLNLVMASPFYNSEYWKNKIEDGTFTYVSANGGNGGQILKYPEFVQRLEDLPVTSDTLSNAKTVEQYVRNDKEIDLLREIAKCHQKLCNADIPESLVRTYAKKYGDASSEKTRDFLYGTMSYLDKNKYGEGVFGFPVNKDDAERYYNVLKEFLTNFKDDSSVVSENNTFVMSFLQQKKKNGDKMSLDDITGSKSDDYKPFFAYVRGQAIENILTFEEDSYIIKAINSTYENVINVGGLSAQLAPGKALGTNKVTKIVHGGFINVKGFINDIQTKIDELDNSNKSIEKEATDELKEVYENIIGFSPTVENFYRMLFAHIDCFINYFHKEILSNVSVDIKNKQRTLNYLGISVNETDIPRSAANTTDANKGILDVYAFPAYYIKDGKGDSSKEVAEYPGNAKENIPFKNIREVSAVEEILQGIKLLTKKLDIIVENGGRNPEYDSPISKLSAFYRINPWETLSLDKNNDTNDTYKILYYFMCLLANDKLIGTKITTEDTNDIPSYYTRHIDKFLNADISSTKTLKDVMRQIANKLESNGFDTLPSTFFQDYKAMPFILENDILKLDSNKLSDINLCIDGQCLNGSTSEILPEIKLNERQQLFEFTGVNDLTTLSESEMKAFNSALVRINEGNSYLSNVNGIELGDYCVSGLKEKTTTKYTYESEVVPTMNKTINLTLQCKNNAVYQIKYPIFKKGKNTIGYLDDKTDYYKILAKSSWFKEKLVNAYNDVDESCVVDFVGRKKFGEKIGAPLVFYGSKNDYIIDSYPAVNLFSGIKQWYLRTGESDKPNKIIWYEDGEMKFDENAISVNGTKIFNDNNKDDYMPLIDSIRCNVAEENEKKYAFATYFLATMCGRQSLKNTITALSNPIDSLAQPFRTIDLLYLAGILFFVHKDAQNKSTWYTEDDKKIIDLYELITTKGTLGYGLVSADGIAIDNITSSQEKVSINTDLVETIYPLLFEKFQSWCDELFDTYYDRLAHVNDVGVNDDEYYDCSGFGTYDTTDMPDNQVSCIVQGYNPNGTCGKWLHNLAYSYTHVILLNSHVAKSYYLTAPKDVTLTASEVALFLKKLSTKLEDESEEEKKQREQSEDKSNTTEDQKRVLYYLLKNLYDKWLCSYSATDFELHSPADDLNMRKARFQLNQDIAPEKRSEYNNFVYVDQFFRDISSKYIMDAKIISQIVKDTYKGKENIDVYNFMSYMAEKNKLLFLALPIYNNIYDATSFPEIFRPNTLYGDTATERSRGIGTTYVLMYTNEVSHHVADGESGDYYRDYPDIGDVTHVNCEDLKLFDFNSSDNNNSDLNFNVSAFAVTYAKQNQMYFKKVNVSMDNPKVTDESIRNLLMLSDGGGGGDTNQPIAIGQNIYSIYSNRSYTCTVEMMGCMNIMPLMYFQLNNIPMFRGLYMIINVKHSIVAGNMTTTFTGVRVSKYSIPNLNNFVLNSEIFNKLKGTIGGSDGTVYSGDLTDLISGLDRTLNADFKYNRLKKAVGDSFDTYFAGMPHTTSEDFKAIDNKLFKLIKDGTIQLSELKDQKGTTVKVLPGLVEDLRAIFNELNNMSVNGNKLDWSVSSSYRGSNTVSGGYSAHVLGMAVDINATSYNNSTIGTANELNADVIYDRASTLKKAGSYKTYSDLYYKTDDNKRFRTWRHPAVQTFMKHGWGWGIYTGGSKRLDLMHFSFKCDNDGKTVNGITKRVGN